MPSNRRYCVSAIAPTNGALKAKSRRSEAVCIILECSSKSSTRKASLAMVAESSMVRLRGSLPRLYFLSIKRRGPSAISSFAPIRCWTSSPPIKSKVVKLSIFEPRSSTTTPLAGSPSDKPNPPTKVDSLSVEEYGIMATFFGQPRVLLKGAYAPYALPYCAFSTHRDWKNRHCTFCI